MPAAAVSLDSDRTRQEVPSISGQVPAFGEGCCPFRTRCAHATDLQWPRLDATRTRTIRITRHHHSRHSKPLTVAGSCVGSATIGHGTWNGRSVRQGGSPGNPLEAWTLAGDYLVFALPPRPGWRVSAMGGHDSSVIRRLARMVPAPPGKPVREEAAQGQRRARRLAERPGTWDRHQAAMMMAGFDAAAAGWDAGRGAYRRPVLADAVERGGPFRPGRAVEIASGTGLLMPLIRQVWPEVIAVDLSRGMLIRSAAGCRLQADAARLPLADGSAAAVVIGDGPLFAAEAARVMADGAALVWSNALGDGAPFFVPTEILAAAMAAATGRAWDAVESQAHWGSWAVLRPSGPPQADAGPAGEYAPRLPGPCTGTAGSKAAPRAGRPAEGGYASPRGRSQYRRSWSPCCATSTGDRKTPIKAPSLPHARPGHGTAPLLGSPACAPAPVRLPSSSGRRHGPVLCRFGKVCRAVRQRQPTVMVTVVGQPVAGAAAGGVHGFAPALTSFVGRAIALSAVASLLDDYRLVTVTGPGGSGKTRLAGEVAEQVAGRFADGVWLAELAHEEDPAGVAAVVAAALGIREQPGVPGRRSPRGS